VGGSVSTTQRPSRILHLSLFAGSVALAIDSPNPSRLKLAGLFFLDHSSATSSFRYDAPWLISIDFHHFLTSLGRGHILPPRCTFSNSFALSMVRGGPPVTTLYVRPLFDDFWDCFTLFRTNIWPQNRTLFSPDLHFSLWRVVGHALFDSATFFRSHCTKRCFFPFDKVLVPKKFLHVTRFTLSCTGPRSSRA
jgi:hypothetical protein